MPPVAGCGGGLTDVHVERDAQRGWCQAHAGADGDGDGDDDDGVDDDGVDVDCTKTAGQRFTIKKINWYR